MAVKIVPKFTKKEITAMMQRRMQNILNAIKAQLQFVGEKFVKDAREKGQYVDRTGNLRGSIGYVILYNGAQLNKNIDGTRDGILYATRVIADIKQKYPKGLVLICVAGMDYAAAVEAKGYDVISSSSITAAADLKTRMKRLKETLKTK